MQNTGRYRQVRASTSKNRCVARRYVQRGFARQQWRAWIETLNNMRAREKPRGFARQQWRAWIETRKSVVLTVCL